MTPADASTGFRSAGRDRRNDEARLAGVRIPLRAARLAAQNEREGLLRRLGEQGQTAAEQLAAEIALLNALEAMLGGETREVEPARGVRAFFAESFLASAASLTTRLRSTGRDRSSRDARREAVAHALTDAAASARQEAHGLDRRYNQELAESAALSDTDGRGEDAEEDGGRLRALELSVTYLPTRLEALRAQAALFESLEQRLTEEMRSR